MLRGFGIFNFWGKQFAQVGAGLTLAVVTSHRGVSPRATGLDLIGMYQTIMTLKHIIHMCKPSSFYFELLYREAG